MNALAAEPVEDADYDQRRDGSQQRAAEGLVDACVYYLVWFIRGRWQPGPQLLSEFPQLLEWEKR